MNNQQRVFAALLSTVLLSTISLSGCGSSSSSSAVESEVISNDNSGNTTDNDSTTNASNECELDEIEVEMLSQINAARATARMCGTDSYAATTQLQWNCSLKQAALAHSTDMETNNFFSHTGSDGLQVSDRVNAENYSWMAVGENIAAGQTTVSQVMQGWLNSPGHCSNIMSASYTEVGASLVSSTTADYPTYWTQVFAAAR